MAWPCVTIDAAMFAPAVRIDAVRVRDIGTVILRQNGFCSILEELRWNGSCFLMLTRFDIEFLEMKFLEPVRRVKSGAAAFVCCGHERELVKITNTDEK